MGKVLLWFVIAVYVVAVALLWRRSIERRRRHMPTMWKVSVSQLAHFDVGDEVRIPGTGELYRVTEIDQDRCVMTLVLL